MRLVEIVAQQNRPSLIYLDTHVVVWLYAGQVHRFSKSCWTWIDQSQLLVSPMVLLEIDYLKEIGRINIGADTLLGALAIDLGLQVCQRGFSEVVAIARRQSWTREPFDRLIVAQAELAQAPLVTKDKTIRHHYPRAVWD